MMSVTEHSTAQSVDGHDALADPTELARGRANQHNAQRRANRRIGWLLALVAVAIFAASMLAQS